MRITKGCPLCSTDVIGSWETGFYCKECNVIFRKRHVIFKHLKEDVRRTVLEHFTVEKPVQRVIRKEPLLVPQEPIEVMTLSEMKETLAQTAKEHKNVAVKLKRQTEKIEPDMFVPIQELTKPKTATPKKQPLEALFLTKATTVKKAVLKKPAKRATKTTKKTVKNAKKKK